jgi:spore photoproduct lyase
MFEKIFIEKNIKENKRAREILTKLPNSEIIEIDKIENYFGKVKKPYLQKRETLNLYLGEKKGQLVKLAPNAYGLSGEPHYYFVHAYNCIYECDYCYLQGYFHSPDIVLFINHEEIFDEIKKTCATHSNKVWFHAGEYSDSLALSNISGEIPLYFELFKNLPNAYLELRTKSINIKEISNQSPLKNVITSFSLSPAKRAKENDLKTPSTNLRLQAIKTLYEKGHPIGIHFDPIIYSENFLNEYESLCIELNQAIPISKIQYVSLGVVRFTKDVFYQVKQNYPDSNLLAQDFVTSFDNKIRYNRPMRLWMLQKVKQTLLKFNIAEDKIYFCMEDE